MRRSADCALEPVRVTPGMELVQGREIGNRLLLKFGKEQPAAVPGSGWQPHFRRRNTMVPLVPPNPNELDSATSMRCSRVVPGT